jgi:nicotinate phosphoribosyltransferase
MQQFALAKFPDEMVEYRFINRKLDRKFFKEFVHALNAEILCMGDLSLTSAEFDYLKSECPFLTTGYLCFLKNYRYNPSEVEVKLTEEKDLEISIKGPWVTTILWEVPLLALISQLYFEIVDKEWTMDGQNLIAFDKADRLQEDEVCFADFGTRRRRSFESQELFIKQAYLNGAVDHSGLQNYFVGTSNVFLAMKYKVKPIGTMAHELFMFISALISLRRANKFALEYWNEVYQGNLGIALSDTFTTEVFFGDFDKNLARAYDGVRHDSGDPIDFVDRVISHYKSLGIDPLSKTIVFSDGLNVEKAIAIKNYCEGKIKCSFGIGTHFSNDFKGSPALNMVIKLWSANGVPVVKISDEPGKICGDVEARTIANWVFLQKSIFDFPLKGREEVLLHRIEKNNKEKEKEK